MADAQTPIPQAPAEVLRFCERLAASLADASFARLALGQPRGAGGVQRVLARRIALRGEPQLQFTLRHPTKDVTRNLPLAEAVSQVGVWLASDFAHGHLLTATHDVQAAMTRKGAWQLRAGRLPAPQAAARADAGHDRERSRPLSLAAPFLGALGVTDAQQRLVPAMARKWRQIAKFGEVIGHAIEHSPLREAHALRVLDFGAGKGYLTFAVHHLLVARGVQARVTGVEIRPELVEAANGIARGLNLEGLAFVAGDIHGHPREPVDLMIALHACDIATDVALHRGITCGAAVIVCSPCCHKQLRPQLATPPLLEPLLRHGIHAAEFAEMLTDSLRALLLESHGYDARVFEFVSPEHTSKNKIVLGVRRAQPDDPERRARALAQVDELMQRFGLRSQHLHHLLQADAAAA